MEDIQLPVFYGLRSYNHSWNDSATVAPPGVDDAAYNITGLADTQCIRLSRFFFQTILAGVMCVAGIVMNGFSIAVLSRDRETTPISSLLLRSLAFADIFFLSCWIIAWTLPSALDFMADTDSFQNAYHYWRIYSYPLIFIGQMATIWTTVLIAASRFIAVSLPYRAPTFCTVRGTWFRLAGIAVFSVAYNIPRFFEVRVRSVVEPGNRRYDKTDFGKSYSYLIVYFETCYYVFSFFLPLLLLTIFNVQLIADYRRISRKRRLMLSSGRTSYRENHEQNITLIMIIIIVVFVLCNTPARILQVVTSSYASQPCPSTLFFLIQFSSVLELLNSTVNFFIYFIFRKQFRHILQRGLCNRYDHTAMTSTLPQPSHVAPSTEAPSAPQPLQNSQYKSIMS